MVQDLPLEGFIIIGVGSGTSTKKIIEELTHIVFEILEVQYRSKNYSSNLINLCGHLNLKIST